MHRLALFVATCGFIGYIPFAPGTFGSIPGLVLAFVLKGTPAWWDEWLAVAVLTAIGVWAATVAERHFGHTDPGPVVIDEVVGMMITVGGLRLGWIGMLTAFVVFRVCDVIKPFPARRLERLPGGLGVIMDDVMAAVWAHVVMQVMVRVLPGWML